MKWQYWVVVTMVVLAIITTVIWAYNAIDCSRTDMWLKRAQVAGSPAQTAEFLGEYKEALRERGVMGDKYWTIFKYPSTTVALHTKVVDALAIRALALAEQDPTDESYQMGLINLETDVNDLGAVAFAVWGAEGGFWVQWFCVIFWFLMVVFLVWGSLADL